MTATPSPQPESRASEVSHEKTLTLNDTYLCPLCRYGQLQPMVLMDAYACNFCRHVLSANIEQQSVQVVDSTDIPQVDSLF